MIGRRHPVAILVFLTTVLLLSTMMITPSPAIAGTGWQGEYYSNPDLNGTPTLVRTDPAIAFYWGNGSPDPRIPKEFFSVRWTRKRYFREGRYRFYTRTDDGVRLFVDGRPVIDRWVPMPPTTHSGEIDLSAGEHVIRVEYFERTGMASARVWWVRVGPRTTPTDAWRGEYFRNKALAGTPALVRSDEQINFDWYTGSPDASIPADGFSIRWTRDLYFDEGRYDFLVEADDGVRVYLDGRLIIHEWHDSPGNRYKATVTLSRGVHSLRVEYYENTGRARVRFWWERRPERQVGNLITCMRPYDSWIKVYRRMPDGTWQDLNPHGWGPIDPSGFIKIDGLPIEPYYGGLGQPYRVELWVGGALIRSVGNTDIGQPEFRLYPWRDNVTPWGCPVF